MFKNSKHSGKIIGFIIALVLFITANVIQSHVDDKIKGLNSQIARIEKDQEAYLRLILLGKDDFHMGEFYITLGLMTVDQIHDISGIFNPIATSMIRGLKSLNETLPEDIRSYWSGKIEDMSSNFLISVNNKNFNEFLTAFNASNELFRKISVESDKQNEKMAEKKEEMRKQVSSYTSFSNLLLTVNTIILLIQLFFNNLYDIYIDRKIERQKN